MRGFYKLIIISIHNLYMGRYMQLVKHEGIFHTSTGLMIDDYAFLFPIFATK